MFTNTQWLKAVEEGTAADVKNLLDQNADVDQRDRFQETALHRVAWCGKIETAKTLLLYKATVDARDKHEMTPLLVASAYSQKEIVSLLIEHKADVTARNCWGHTVAEVEGKRR